jgi:hypothetical protein
VRFDFVQGTFWSQEIPFLQVQVMLACWHPDPMQRPILKHIIDFMKQYEIELTTREASMFIKKYSNKRACEVRFQNNTNT